MEVIAAVLETLKALIGSSFLPSLGQKTITTFEWWSERKLAPFLETLACDRRQSRDCELLSLITRSSNALVADLFFSRSCLLYTHTEQITAFLIKCSEVINYGEDEVKGET